MNNQNQKLENIRDSVSKPLAKKTIINEKPQEKCKICGKKLKPFLIPYWYSCAKWHIDENCLECYENYIKLSEKLNKNWAEKVDMYTKLDQEYFVTSHQETFCENKKNSIKQWEKDNKKSLSSEWETAKKPMEIIYDTKKIINELRNELSKKIPQRFWEVSLFECTKEIQNYFINQLYKKKGLFLWGACGTGKTYAVYALVMYLIAIDEDVWVFNLPKLLNVIKASFKKKSIYDESTDDYSYAFVHDMKDIDKLVKVGILIIDDIGAEKPTEWVAETLYSIINERYEKMKITIFTSNLSLDDLALKLGDRIVSRIAGMCEIYELKGDDKRLK